MALKVVQAEVASLFSLLAKNGSSRGKDRLLKMEMSNLQIADNAAKASLDQKGASFVRAQSEDPGDDEKPDLKERPTKSDDDYRDTATISSYETLLRGSLSRERS